MHYEADENELMNLVRSVNNHMNHVLNQFYSPYGLTRPQAIVLSEIERNGPVTVSLLAHRLGMTCLLYTSHPLRSKFYSCLSPGFIITDLTA